MSALVLQSFGLVTPLGLSAAATWRALMEGQSIERTGHIDLAKEPARDRCSQLACMAATEAIARSRWTGHPPRRTALIVGTSKGAIDAWIQHSPDPTALPRSDKKAGGATWPIGLHTVADELLRQFAGRIGLPACSCCVSTTPVQLAFDQVRTCSAACASGLYALAMAALLLESNAVDRALVVAAESSLDPLVLQSYRRLGVLARDGQRTRPFDADRAGFLVSEAAAAVCLERREPDRGDIILESWALGSDASHLTGMSPDGMPLRRCLARVIDGPAIDLVHAHATGTLMNDPIELGAIESTLPPSGERRPCVYSHKGALGHSMGASGLISIVLGAMMHRTGRVLANVNTPRPISASRVTISPALESRSIARSLVIAAGFGGPLAVAALRTAAL